MGAILEDVQLHAGATMNRKDLERVKNFNADQRSEWLKTGKMPAGVPSLSNAGFALAIAVTALVVTILTLWFG